MEKVWAFLAILVSNFTSIFHSHESVDYARAHFSDLSCILFFGACILAGILVAVFGYRLAYIVMFLSAAVFGVTVGWGFILPLLERHTSIGSGEYPWIAWALPVVLTVIISILVIKFLKFSLFLIGGTVGFFAGHWFASIIESDTLATIIIVTIAVLLFGFLVMLVRKAILKLAISLFGAFVAAYGTSALLVLFGFPTAYGPAWPVTCIVVAGIAIAYHICSKSKGSSKFDGDF